MATKADYQPGWRKYSAGLAQQIEVGAIKIAPQYASYLGQAAAIRAEYADRVASGLNPVKVRELSLAKLEAIEGKLTEANRAQAQECRGKAEKRRADVAFERKNNPALVRQGIEEAQLVAAAMLPADKAAMASEFAAGRAGISREMALVLAASFPDTGELGLAIRAKIKSEGMLDPVACDGEARTLDALAESLEARGPLVDATRVNQRGEEEGMSFPIASILDLDS